MAQTAQYIVQDNLNKIIDLLNQAFAEEWLAYYQYWIGAKVAAGPMRSDITDEFMEHAEEELKHADRLADRIIQLGGTPVLTPEKCSNFFDSAFLKFGAPMVMGYWWGPIAETSARRSVISFGGAKSGKPWAKFIAPQS